MAKELRIRVCVLEDQFVELADAGAGYLLNVLAHEAARSSIGASTVVHEADTGWILRLFSVLAQYIPQSSQPVMQATFHAQQGVPGFTV